MFKSTVNKKFEFLIEKIRGQFFVNEKEIKIDIKKINASSFHIIYGNKSYLVSLGNFALQQKQLDFSIFKAYSKNKQGSLYGTI